ncbi:MAG: S26 family signal peptidase [Streptococcus sp.]
MQIKRSILSNELVAIGGDYVEIKDNIVYLNGKKLDENYVNGVMANNEDMSINIPEGKVLLWAIIVIIV